MLPLAMVEHLDQRIFSYLIELGESIKPSKGFTEDGEVTACLVRNKEILASASSATGGIIIHAEQNLLGYIQQRKIKIDENDILYSTLEPCAGRFDIDGGAPDCVTLIIRSGIKNVIYGASDPAQSTLTRIRFDTAGINLKQTENIEIRERCRNLFNKSSENYKI
jgi:pyrimidine deaminase RibD-like protein